MFFKSRRNNERIKRKENEIKKKYWNSAVCIPKIEE